MRDAVHLFMCHIHGKVTPNSFAMHPKVPPKKIRNVSSSKNGVHPQCVRRCVQFAIDGRNLHRCVRFCTVVSYLGVQIRRSRSLLYIFFAVLVHFGLIIKVPSPSIHTRFRTVLFLKKGEGNPIVV